MRNEAYAEDKAEERGDGARRCEEERGGVRGSRGQKRGNGRREE